MSQITANLDSTVTQDRYVLPSPLIRTYRKLELREESWEGSLMQENMAGECRWKHHQDRGLASTLTSSGHRWCGYAVLAPIRILVCFKYLTFLYHLGLLRLTKHYLIVTSCLK